MHRFLHSWLRALLMVMMVIAPGAWAQVPAAGSGVPVNIQAQGGIEWDRQQNVYIARDDVVATYDQLTVKTDELRAYYQQLPNGKTDIIRLEAHGDVVIQSQAYEARGDEAIMTMETKQLVLRGQSPQLRTANEVIQAGTQLTYDGQTQQATAEGGSQVTRGKNRLVADRLVAQMVTQNNQTDIRDVVATGNLIIQTPDGVVRGDKAHYNRQNGQVVVLGQVCLKRSEGELRGDRAEVNLNTGQSRLIANPTSGGRVTGSFEASGTELKP